ncbi:MAG TPA: twin-arginine translocase subunit TatC [Acidimicrobiales bacterium]|nr:twin-arginine translocase subunit TatC [Acidimicrobiales bacterium]
MTLVEHLTELRKRLVICVASFVVTATVAWVLYPHILRLLERPYCLSIPKGHSCSLVVMGPLDAFGIRLDLAGYGGLILASPVILFQLWRFVTPGLKAHERRYAVAFTLSAIVLFIGGAYVAWLTFPHALSFLHSVGGPGIVDLFTPSKYLTLIMALMAIFGISFEFPIVLVGLELAHVVTPEQLGNWRRVAIVAIVVFAGVATPSSDPFSMLALALPMLAFYEVSILIGRIARR